MNGDLRLKGGTLDLNGYTLTVKGSVWVNDDIVSIGSGTMRVAGDFELRPDENGWSSGELYMTDKAGALITGGSPTKGCRGRSPRKSPPPLWGGGWGWGAPMYSPF